MKCTRLLPVSNWLASLLMLVCNEYHPSPRYNRIKVVLAEHEKTNYWLADKLGMNRTTVSKWCRNEMQPRIDTLFQIAEVLDIDVRELLVSNKK